MADRRTTFIQTYMPYAQEASAMTGIDAGVILAQAAHETGWGRSAPGNNFFGIKGGGQTFATHEYVNGKRVNMRAGFRRYDDPGGSFRDWAELMMTPRYAKVLAAKTPEEQIQALKDAGYATDPAYVSKLNSVRSQVTQIAGDIAPVAPADISGIMDVASINDGTSTVPYQPTAAQGYAPDLGGVPPAQAAISDMLAGGGDLTPEQIDILTATDAAGNYLNPPGGPPMPSPPPQWASAQGFPMDEALTGRSADQVLMGGPRMDPRRSPPGTGPMPPDMGAMRSPADVLNAGPNLDPRRVSPASAPIGPTTAQGVLDMGPNLRPSNVPDPRPRPERGAGIPDPRMRPDPASLPQRGFPTAFGEQPQPLMGGMSAAMGDAPSRTGDLSAAMGGPPSRSGDLSAAMGGPPAPPDPLADFGTRDIAAELQGQRTIADANYYRPQNIMQPPSPPSPASPYSTTGTWSDLPDPTPRGFPAFYGEQPPPATMGERFDMAGTQRMTDQMFGLPPMNGASFPGPDPVNGTAAAGSTTGEFFTPAPPMPQPAPDPLAGRFDDFTPAGPGMIADLAGAYENRMSGPAPQPTATLDYSPAQFGIAGRPPTPTPPGVSVSPLTRDPSNPLPDYAGLFPPSPMAAQDGINSVFGAPPAAAMPPNLAIPFNEVPRFDAGRFIDAGMGSAPPPPPANSYPPGIPAPSFDAGRFTDAGMPGEFAGGSVVNDAASSDVVAKWAADNAPMAQAGPPMPPQALPQAQPAQAPRQTNVGAERQRSGTIGRILGGLLGGPVGALGGGLLGGGGGGIFGGASFGGQPTFNAMGGGTAPYGNGGSTTYQKGTSNALGGSNALSWKTSNGGTITAYTDPNTGQTFHSYG